MPNSFINTGGFESPVMPAIQFASPQYFGQTYPNIIKGITSGADLMGELQRQRGEAQRQQQAAALNPLTLQHAQNLNAMDPIDLQKAKIALANASQTKDTVVSSRPIAINRRTGQPYGVGEPGVAAEDTPASNDPFDIVEENTIESFNPVTQQIDTHKTYGKTIETDEERQAREAKTEVAGREVGAKETTANAAAARAKTAGERLNLGGANSTFTATGDDGKLHKFSKTLDDEGNLTYKQGPLAGADEILGHLRNAQADEAAANADRITRTPVPETAEDIAAARQAAAISKGKELFKELEKTPAGRAANIEAQINLARAKAGQAAKPLSPASVKAEADAQKIIDARAPSTSEAQVSVNTGGFEVGKKYMSKDSDGKVHTATFLGNGKWQED